MQICMIEMQIQRIVAWPCGGYRCDMSSSERGARVRFPPPLVFLSSLAVGLGLGYGFAPARAPVAAAVRLPTGIFLQLVGLVLVVWARVLFRRTGQSPFPWKPTPQLLSKGPYRYTRNPMYLGVTLFQTGLGITVDNLWIAVLAMPALLAVHFIAVLPEERYLSEKFGDGYRRYRAEVRRYF